MTEALPLAPDAVAEWMPFWKAAGFFLATFVLEDAAAVGAGLLLAGGSISWPAAFTACFLGIWLGDAGLYALARFAGRGWFERSALRKFAPQVARSEKWFAERGTPILIFSRCVPGARLPTYLAAGFLRVPAARFLLVTGMAAFVLDIRHSVPRPNLRSPVAQMAGRLQIRRLGVAGAGLVLFVTLQLLRRAFVDFDSRKFAARLGRWRHWEFWPGWLFYPPVVIYYLWLALKYRGAMLPTAANPGIFSGGMVGESKMATLRDLMRTSPEFTAEAELLAGATPDERLDSLREICARRNIPYPFILKPDLGQRGAGIKLIRHEAQAAAYLRQTDAALLVQRFAAGPHEAGIFYYRFPGEPRGHDLFHHRKDFSRRHRRRASHGRGTGLARSARPLSGREISAPARRAAATKCCPPAKSSRWSRRATTRKAASFATAKRLDTPALAARMDEISRKLNGFFIGRYDLRFASEADLRAGRNFQIIELNGAAAEAAQHLRRAQFPVVGLSDAVPAMGIGLRHRRGKPPARLRADEDCGLLAGVAQLFRAGRHLSGGAIEPCAPSPSSRASTATRWG